MSMMATLGYRTPEPVAPVYEGFKRCSYCGEYWPLDAYWKRASSPDGREEGCKCCREHGDFRLARFRRCPYCLEIRSNEFFNGPRRAGVEGAGFTFACHLCHEVLADFVARQSDSKPESAVRQWYVLDPVADPVGLQSRPSHAPDDAAFLEACEHAEREDDDDDDAVVELHAERDPLYDVAAMDRRRDLDIIRAEVQTRHASEPDNGFMEACRRAEVAGMAEVDPEIEHDAVDWE